MCLRFSLYRTISGAAVVRIDIPASVIISPRECGVHQVGLYAGLEASPLVTNENPVHCYWVSIRLQSQY